MTEHIDWPEVRNSAFLVIRVYECSAEILRPQGRYTFKSFSDDYLYRQLVYIHSAANDFLSLPADADAGEGIKCMRRLREAEMPLLHELMDTSEERLMLIVGPVQRLA